MTNPSADMRHRLLPVLIGIVLGVGAALTGCQRGGPSRLEQIWASGRITLITDNSAHSYYRYRGQPMGFEYDLAKAFADYLVVDLEVVSPGWSEMFALLRRGGGDFIAASLTATPQRRKDFDFSDPYMRIRQYVIAHKDNADVRALGDLNGKTIHVRQGTSYHQRLEELKREGLDINLVLHQNVPTEELIRRVAEGEIELTVADTNVAMLNRRYYPEIRMKFPISRRQYIAWAVRKGDRQLLEQINRFLAKIRSDGTFNRIHYAYYAYVDTFDYVDIVKFHERIDTRLPNYEAVIRREARRYGFDWRLVAAVIYQESHFDPQAASHTGVRGLMQLTRDTARLVGVDNRLNPEQSIVGGVKYLNLLYNRFADIPGYDRWYFTLAAYNVGYGHVRDAQKIAAGKGLPAESWNALKKTLPLLAYPKYYRRTEYGYARGKEPVRYVKRVLTYYDVLEKRGLEEARLVTQ
jgi:membrane-bound lytic murein transglycosylase F